MEKAKNTPDEVVEEIEEDGIIEYTTREEYISSCFYAISSLEGFDTGMMSKTDANKINKIRKRCLLIIDSMVNEMYDELFNVEQNDNE
jgi:hypothetical protein